MGARRRTRQGLSIHVESVLGKGISMQIETVAKEGFLPVRVHPTDAGADLRADIPEPVTLQPRESTFFNTGIEVAIPEGYFGALAIRSSLACKHGLMLANSLGIIDSCYRGPVKAKLVNIGRRPYTINPGDRIAQLLIIPCVHATFPELEVSDMLAITGGLGVGLCLDGKVDGAEDRPFRWRRESILPRFAWHIVLLPRSERLPLPS